MQGGEKRPYTFPGFLDPLFISVSNAHFIQRVRGRVSLLSAGMKFERIAAGLLPSMARYLKYHFAVLVCNAPLNVLRCQRFAATTVITALFQNPGEEGTY